ncbi:MAG TPA: extracellular solute-binding protein, partial [Candidatus Sulfomarinibacteraceae bacterium]|nr:extracellular solute-binding protein [Candidatus Sulfomarinibacteraceae bacterium]
MKRQFSLFLVLALIVVLAACGQRPEAPTPQPTEESSAPVADSGEQGDDGPESEPTTAPMTDDTEADGTFWERAQNGEFSGSTVTIFGKWTEAEEENFVAALAPFEEATGIDVEYEGSSEFETLITVRVEGGDAPDVAGFPQPGLLAQFVHEGVIPDHAQFLDVEKLHENYGEAWIDLATVDGQLSGVFYRASTKSIVWYPVEAFEEAGYEIPETWDE